MEITLKTNNATLTGYNTNYVLDFGILKKNSRAKVTLKVDGESLQINTSNTSCSCTRADLNRVNSNTTEVEITYKNTHLVQPFSKQVYLDITEPTESKRVTIEVKGNITL